MVACNYYVVHHKTNVGSSLWGRGECMHYPALLPTPRPFQREFRRNVLNSENVLPQLTLIPIYILYFSFSRDGISER